jgi:nucleotide-binding universal stress UspA family protein
MVHRILVAWDGSAAAEQALRSGQDLAALYQAALTVGSVIEVPVHAEALEDRERTAHEQAEQYRHTLADFLDRISPRGTPPPHTLIHGLDPALALRTFAQQHGYDLIVIGRGHRGIIQRSLVGDVTEVVVREAHCPVLVVGGDS